MSRSRLWYRRRVTVTYLQRTVLAVSSVLVACGGASAATHGGAYTGPNQLDFLVTAPVERQMPPERHRGRAQVVSDDGTAVVLELRMVEGGDTCRITATAAAPAAPGTDDVRSVAGGQSCSSRFMYQGEPTSAVVQIEEGTVTFGADGTLRVDLAGEFAASTPSASQISGVVQWRLEGHR